MSIYRPTPRVQFRGAATMVAHRPGPATPPLTQVANPPAGISLAQAAIGALTVTWGAPATDSSHDAATDFNLQFSPSRANIWTTVHGVTSPYTLSGLPAGAAIDVQLAGVNAAGTSAWSATSTATTAAGVPNAPSGVSLAQATGSGLTVIWTAPAIDSAHNAAAAYNLQFSPSGANTWITVQGVTSPYTLSGLPAGAAIDVQLAGVNAAGTSAWSTVSTLATATASPNMPAGLSLAQAAAGALSVAWTAPTVDTTHGAATGFNLQYSPSGANTWTAVPAVTSPYTLSGLAAGAAFDIQVEAVNSAGTSAWSAASTLSTAIAVPNTPGGVSLAHGSGSNLTVTWNAPATDSTHNAAATFNLRSSPSGANTWTAVSGVTSPYTLQGLTVGTTIDVQIQGANTAGISAWSATSTITTSANGPNIPNVPTVTSVAPPADGTASKLTVTWTAPAVDSTHDAATGYNLRTSPAGAGTWTTVTNVTSPYTLTGLAGATSVDVEVQATNAASSPGAWSAITTGKTWGATVVPGNWVAATAQVHGATVAPNGGVQMTAVAAPTAVTAAAFAWSASSSVLPTTGLINAPSDGQTNGWGQYFSAPATAGTYYLWMLAQGAGGATTGALVTSAITVS